MAVSENKNPLELDKTPEEKYTGHRTASLLSLTLIESWTYWKRKTDGENHRYRSRVARRKDARVIRYLGITNGCCNHGSVPILA